MSWLGWSFSTWYNRVRYSLHNILLETCSFGYLPAYYAAKGRYGGGGRAHVTVVGVRNVMAQNEVQMPFTSS